MVDILTTAKVGLVLIKPIRWAKTIWEALIGPWRTMPALLQRVEVLDAKILKTDTWQEEKKRYQLTDCGGETYAYSLKPGMENGEVPHLCCENCFDNRKSILHLLNGETSRKLYRCYACDKTFRLGAKTTTQEPNLR